MLDLLVIGDVAVDLYMLIDTPKDTSMDEKGQVTMCFLHGSKIPVKSYKHTLGGNPTHVGIGASRLGLKTKIYTELGDDQYGNEFIDKFTQEKIDTSDCKKNTGTNTNTSALIVCNNDRTIFAYHEPRNYDFNFDQLEIPKFIYYTSMGKGFEPFQEKLAQYKKNNPNVVIAFNPGSTQMESDRQVLEQALKITDIIFVNVEEANRLSNANIFENNQMQQLHIELQKLGPKLSVITAGKDGSSAYDGNEFIQKGPPEVNGPIVDKTGAGDSYAAAFLSAIFYGKSLQTAIEWGNKNAASIVTQVGAVEGLLYRDEIE